MPESRSHDGQEVKKQSGQFFYTVTENISITTFGEGQFLSAYFVPGASFQEMYPTEMSAEGFKALGVFTEMPCIQTNWKANKISTIRGRKKKSPHTQAMDSWFGL